MTPTPSPTPSDALQRAKPHPRWLLKNLIFLPLALGFAIWALADAVWIYPERGRLFAAHQELAYLQALKAAGAARLTYDASVPDPAKTYSELVERADELSSATPGSEQAILAARLTWLETLRPIGALNPAHTTYAQPGTSAAASAGGAPAGRPTAEARLAEITGLAGKTPPKPLAFYDLPSQWVFFVVGLAIAVHISWLLLRVFTTRYQWDAAGQRLVLPNGASLTAGDLAEPLDKRQWHKFIVFASLRPGHAAGRDPIRFDTYRHAKLEGWLLELERTAFPEVMQADSAGQDQAPTDGGGAQSAAPANA